jgi:hypothetical protein
MTSTAAAAPLQCDLAFEARAGPVTAAAACDVLAWWVATNILAHCAGRQVQTSSPAS